jgi:ribosomal protein S18 acetylase RimI-like enzyme
MLKGPKRNSGSEFQYSTRVASPADAEILAEVGRKTFSETFSAANTAENMRSYLEKTFAVDQVQKELEDPQCSFILMYDNEKIAGYAKIRRRDTDKNGIRKLEIERIYADKEYIGKKAGKTLMQACLDTARNEGYKTVWLGVWEHNERAISFYEQWGFKTTGAHPFVLGEDVQIDLIMEKTLDENPNENTSL